MPGSATTPTTPLEQPVAHAARQPVPAVDPQLAAAVGRRGPRRHRRAPASPRSRCRARSRPGRWPRSSCRVPAGRLWACPRGGGLGPARAVASRPSTAAAGRASRGRSCCGSPPSSRSRATRVSVLVPLTGGPVDPTVAAATGPPSAPDPRTTADGRADRAAHRGAVRHPVRARRTGDATDAAAESTGRRRRTGDDPTPGPDRHARPPTATRARRGPARHPRPRTTSTGSRTSSTRPPASRRRRLGGRPRAAWPARARPRRPSAPGAGPTRSPTPPPAGRSSRCRPSTPTSPRSRTAAPTASRAEAYARVPRGRRPAPRRDPAGRPRLARRRRPGPRHRRPRRTPRRDRARRRTARPWRPTELTYTPSGRATVTTPSGDVAALVPDAVLTGELRRAVGHHRRGRGAARPRRGRRHHPRAPERAAPPPAHRAARLGPRPRRSPGRSSPRSPSAPWVEMSGLSALGRRGRPRPDPHLAARPPGRRRRDRPGRARRTHPRPRAELAAFAGIVAGPGPAAGRRRRRRAGPRRRSPGAPTRVQRALAVDGVVARPRRAPLRRRP